MCKCLEILVEKIKESGDMFEPQLENTCMLMNLETSKSTTRAGSLKFSYRKKNKKNNELSIKREKSSIQYAFCPFCGEKYD